MSYGKLGKIRTAIWNIFFLMGRLYILTCGLVKKPVASVWMLFGFSKLWNKLTGHFEWTYIKYFLLTLLCDDIAM